MTGKADEISRTSSIPSINIYNINMAANIFIRERLNRR